MRTFPMSLTVAAVVSCGLAREATAKIYRVVDKHGNVLYTNRPPSHVARRAAKVTATRGKSSQEPARAARFQAAIAEASRRFAIPESFIRAVIRAESNFDPRAVSRAGAEGLMQLIPETARRMGVRDSFDPRDNIMGGARYLRFLADAFAGQLPLMIAGYHAGEEAVTRAGGIPAWSTTRAYVASVLGYLAAFEKR